MSNAWRTKTARQREFLLMCRAASAVLAPAGTAAIVRMSPEINARKLLLADKTSRRLAQPRAKIIAAPNIRPPITLPDRLPRFASWRASETSSKPAMMADCIPVTAAEKEQPNGYLAVEGSLGEFDHRWMRGSIYCVEPLPQTPIRPTGHRPQAQLLPETQPYLRYESLRVIDVAQPHQHTTLPQWRTEPMMCSIVCRQRDTRSRSRARVTALQTDQRCDHQSRLDASFRPDRSLSCEFTSPRSPIRSTP